MSIACEIAEFDKDGADAYHTAARMKVRKGYQLFALKSALASLEEQKDYVDESVSDPQFYKLKDAIRALESEMS